jgi:SAM-dependent methyltransferase
MAHPQTHSQTWDPERYARNARFVADLGAPVVELLAPQAGERILDLGCGDGVLTAKLAAMGCDVVGVDTSRPQIEAARKLGVDARVMDGENLAFDNEFDAVFSNAALHWMRHPDKVIGGVYRALRPKGRFVAEFGGHGCVATIKKALVEALNRRNINGEAAIPWFFPTVEDYSQRLAQGGFATNYIALIPRPTALPGNVTAWPSPRVLLIPCPRPTAPPTWPKSRNPCAPTSATPKATGPPTTSASASPPKNKIDLTASCSVSLRKASNAQCGQCPKTVPPSR